VAQEHCHGLALVAAQRVGYAHHQRRIQCLENARGRELVPVPRASECVASICRGSRRSAACRRQLRRRISHDPLTAQLAVRLPEVVMTGEAEADQDGNPEKLKLMARRTYRRTFAAGGARARISPQERPLMARVSRRWAQSVLTATLGRAAAGAGALKSPSIKRNTVDVGIPFGPTAAPMTSI
jgi:hypothetical protein